MRITIETEDGSKPAMSTVPATTITPTEATSEAITDGGGAPSMPGAAAEGDQGSDGGGPSQALLDTIAAAEVAGLAAAMMPATEDSADGGAGPSAA
jgi:hypothetical protein